MKAKQYLFLVMSIILLVGLSLPVACAQPAPEEPAPATPEGGAQVAKEPVFTVLDPCGWTPERTLQPLSPRLILRDGMGVLRR